MKVYELMNELSRLPSGAEIACAAMLTVSELKAGSQCGKDEYDDILYAVSMRLESVDYEGNKVYLGF